ncbi:pyridoxal phosphate-dependent aminotransferase [Sphingobacterium phlebotomi]|uniref:cysteine-S-conjugate beta-lyase n=1 Tax=Sphingobacterium phlebotomi TaxID=2605433 RepID=A0A5D4H6V1_9SPHI|nr:MalY/PatB family protein [Sphingobacterium phlebotomi]TYR35983.1 pyridoxal phosphate-dependent aminotransferase [Sphingobacterium phlebotomi]
MEYNFDELIDRTNTGSVKWSKPDVLPMWVADMDFKTVPEVTEALTRRASHGIFGYCETPPSFYDAITNWWKKRHALQVENDWIIATPGVMPALAAAVEALTSKGDKIIVQPPVYNHFFLTVKQSHCELVENNLLYDNGNYQIDFEDLEQKAADPAVKLLLFSNPHNPAGRVWTKEELQQIGEICIRHGVVVLSDEIHSDLVYDDFTHVPFTSLGEAYARNSITFSSPSKTFNLAGLQVAYFFTENEAFRKRVKEILTKWEMTMLNIFAIDSLIVSYEKGEHWLESLKRYLHENYCYLTDFCHVHLPELKVIPLQSTYLVWLDCTALGLPSSTITDRLLEHEHLWLNPGIKFGQAGDQFLRMNIACPRELLKEGLKRLEKEYKRIWNK